MASEEAKETLKVVEKEKKKIKPEEKSVDSATIQMLYKAQQDGVETIFDRAETMKPCNIGIQGTCCKNVRPGALPPSFNQEGPGRKGHPDGTLRGHPGNHRRP